ncbi:LamG-like jellyroll fold domain-containing protein [Flavihumibacter petaseus]|uniref:LamG-like jellyroll fold domain-containing protein n=1 Tax=Flavihumibacter petaseus NBRC 106054 TaxID=1220578 RepID=A0A0E9N079_9BACT|nr:LamG-like jellyroll fold domain-containing protein [Flavihumibacter petaseus]GAO42775.1 hypothetical protein FPE01S_01_17930 [Flavihumibacter petaseus NBRC 106054]
MMQAFKTYGSLVALLIAIGACQKMDEPALGSYPEDAVSPGGTLSFYAAMDGTGSDALRNAVDSMRAMFPASNSLTSVEGVSGKAMQGGTGTAIVYPSTNDFVKATSITVSLWLKHTESGKTEFLYGLVDDTYSGWSHSGLFLMMEHGSPTEAVVKMGIMDQWMEWPDSHKFPYPIMDGNWHHLAAAYDETTSKLSWYFDGEFVPDAPASATDVKKDGAARGPLNFTAAKKFIVGGWNKQGGADGPKDDWINSFSGSIDQFRLYNAALTADEIHDLFVNKQ